MKNHIKKLTAFLFVVLLAACCVLAENPIWGGVQQEVYAASVVDSGSCGARAEWVLDDEGTLTISGTGAMTNWAAAEDSTGAPWVAYSAAIKSVVIEKGIVSISENAFYKCTALESITIGESVTTINWDTLRGCAALKNITVSENNASFSDIDGVLFNKAADELTLFPKNHATEYTVPNCTKKIGDSAFMGCKKLREVVISDSVTSIGNNAFNNCSYLSAVTIGKSVKTIGDYAFDSCKKIECIVIPDSVTHIGKKAFRKCNALYEITMGTGIVSIDKEAFIDSDQIANVYIKDLIAWCGIDFASYGSNPFSSGTQLILNGEIVRNLMIPNGVSSIAPYAFESYHYLESVTISDSVTSIGAGAFQYSSIKSINIPDSITSIDDYVFDGCFNLTNITIPDSVTSIGVGAFQHSAIKSINIPNSVTSIGDYAFNSCLYLTTITIPDSVTSIGDYAFFTCSHLTSVTISNSVVSIGNYAFSSCWSLIKIIIPNGVKSMGVSAFHDCSSLKNITLPNGLKTINDEMFSRCTALESVVIPGSVTSIGYGVFNECPLKKIYYVGSESMWEQIDDTTDAIPDSLPVIFNYTPLAITQQPVDTSAELGDKAVVSVKAKGVDLTYQWYYMNITDGSFSKSSCTKADYAFTMSNSSDGRQVYCVITDKYGISKQTETVMIGFPAKILTQPKNGYAKLGEKVTVFVEAKGDGLKYQWYYKNPGMLAFKKSSIKTAEYSAKVTEDSNGRQLYCEIGDRYGNKIKTDVVAMRMAATITNQPADTAAKVGGKVKFSVEAIGDGLTYQWFYKDAKGTEFVKSSAASTNYSTTMRKGFADRQFYCVVTDKYGNTDTSATVKLGLFDVTKQPTNAVAASGKVVSTSVTAVGEGITYKWYVCEPNKTAYYKSSLATNTYSYAMTEAKSGRKAYCVITDKFGNSITTDTVTLSLLAITKQPTNAVAASGKVASATVTAIGDGLTYKWYVCEPGKTSFYKSSLTTNTYSYGMTEAKSGRKAYCVITDKFGNSVKSDTVTLTMASSVKITAQPQSVTAAKGATAKVTLTASGDGLTYTWYYKNKSASSFAKTSSFTSNYYSVAMDSTRDGRQIYCVVADKYGNSVQSDTVTLTMANGVKITSQPKSVTADEGVTAKVTLTASGDGLTYTWYFKNKSDSSFAKTTSFTGNTYSVAMNAARNGRQIYCVVKDKYGNKVQSDTVTLTMTADNSLKITKQPTNAAAAAGKTVSTSITATGEGLTYTWYVLDPGKSEYVKSSITKNTYAFTMSEAKSGRKVYCVVKDEDGNSVKSNTVTLSMS